MRLLTFLTAEQARLGVQIPAGTIDVMAAQAALGVPPRGLLAPESMAELLAGGREALDALADLVRRAGEAAATGPSWLLDDGSLALAPCVPEPGKIICIGLNYRRHAAETGKPVPEVPILFSKYGNALAAAGAQTVLPSVAERYDYEAELCVVVGRRAHAVPEAQALDYVLGYCNANDVSARDLQFRTSQWLLGKTLDGFFPIGPYVVTADEVGDPQGLRVRSWLNGEPRQNSTTADMVFGVAQLIAYISRYITLEPGDLIATGTPEGVIEGRAEKVWMKPGDEVTVEVEKLGRLTSRFIAG